MKQLRPVLRPVLQATAVLLCCASVLAQPVDATKTVVVEPLAAPIAFQQWLTRTVVAVPDGAVDAASIQTVSLNPPTAAPPAAFQVRPVIVGEPTLPLLRSASAPQAHLWSPDLSYQGIHVRLVALDPVTGRTQQRPMNAPPRPGERFKLRIAATFDAVAALDLVVGEPWSGQRIGQVYPAPGLSVHMYAGETVELPMGASDYFSMADFSGSRMVLSVRHARAVGASASDQPAYRSDQATGSSYLQLVPAGMFPVIEQLVTARR